MSTLNIYSCSNWSVKRRKGYTSQHRNRLKKQCLKDFYKKLIKTTVDGTDNIWHNTNNNCDLTIGEKVTKNEQSSSVTQDVLSNYRNFNNVNIGKEMNVINVNGNVIDGIRNDITIEGIENREDDIQTSMFNDDYSADEDGPNDNLVCGSREETKNNSNEIDSDTDEEDETYENPTSNPADADNQEIDRMAKFLEEFLTWCLTSKLSRENLKALMAMLRKYFNAPLPKDPRTLLKTPKGTKLYKMRNGSYWHYGLKKILNKIIEKCEVNKIDIDTIKLSVSVDGAQIGNSSRKGLWIISISDDIFQDVYIIGAHHGEKKPEDSNELMELLVNELIETITHGYQADSYKKKYNVRLVALICDVPAKSYVLKVKGHSGYDSCTKCEIKGVRLGNVVYFHVDVNKLPPLRTDEKVKKNVYKNIYQHGESILTKIPHFGLVSNVYIDIMHQMYLGLTRKLVMLWMYGPKGMRLNPKKIKKLSMRLEIIRECTPIDFNRTVTDLELTKRTWKATVYRQFLIYVGPPALKGILRDDFYDNFIALHIAVTILITKDYCIPALINYADELLKYFVSTFATLYGERYVSHNVHNCLHLADEARSEGSLESRSAFRFENAIREVIKMITKPEYALQQLDRRTAEKDMYAKTCKDGSYKTMQFDILHRNGPIIFNETQPSQQWKRMEIKSFKVCCDRLNDQFVLIHENDNTKIVQCMNFVQIKSEFYVVGKEMKVTGNVYDRNYCSSDWSMVEIMNPAENIIPLKMWLCNNIKSKLFKMVVDDKHIIVPLRHTQ